MVSWIDSRVKIHFDISNIYRELVYCYLYFEQGQFA